jgi:hypothetical protein
MLSAYLDGKLDPTERGRIEDHISRCEDCYFVVRETAIALGEADEPLGAAAPGVPLGRPRSGFLSRYLLPLAAALVVGVGPIMLWRQATHVAPYSEAVRPLVEAVGERRFFEPRLTGGFKFGPTVASTRSAGTGPRSEAWAMLAVAGELRDRPAAASTGARASAAAAALFLGEVDRAVAEYSRLAMDEPTTADWPSNLAAALLVRASASPDGAERDRLEALRYAEQAARLPEATWASTHSSPPRSAIQSQPGREGARPRRGSEAWLRRTRRPRGRLERRGFRSAPRSSRGCRAAPVAPADRCPGRKSFDG